MNNELYEIQNITGTDLVNIDEEKLPIVLQERLTLLENTNMAYAQAKEKEEIARKKVEEVLIHADELVEKANSVGGHTASTKKFLWMEWTSNSDEIYALKENLKEIIEHGEESAIAQRELVEVQSALAESQTALLEVQKTQMEYQAQIADATKFLYGLGAYNMGATQSVLVNLKAVLSGASKEKLGEMAQQQLFLAMDQLKNQESIILKINENKRLIEDLQVTEKQHDFDINRLDEENDAQDALISSLQIADEEQDEEIARLDNENDVQDVLITNLQIADEEQDKEIARLDEENDILDVTVAQLGNTVQIHTEKLDKLSDDNTLHDKSIKELKDTEKKHLASIIELQGDRDKMQGEIKELYESTNALDVTTSKIGWKIAISLVAGASLILNILQIIGVL